VNVITALTPRSCSGPKAPATRSICFGIAKATRPCSTSPPAQISNQHRDAIDAVSPALHADKFTAPVLLIHGASDTVVPIRQSEVMNDALKNAQKSVQYIRINGDDHSLVDNDSRRIVLTALGEFLDKHIGK
jgi:dipeptidyl aminopeptidase/acylaminoacyl peptidase